MGNYKSYKIKDILHLLLKSIDKSTLYADSIYEYVESHPFAMSLASISYALNKAGIENIGANVSFETLKNDIDKPVIVHLNIENNLFAIVTKIDGQYIYIRQYGKDAKVDINEFKDSFSGNILIINSETEHINIPTKKVISGYIYKISPISLPILFVLLCIFFYRPEGLFEILYASLFSLGLIVSILLFARQMGFSDKFMNQICRGNKSDSNVSCDSVLASKGAKFFDIITWSEVGIIYFSTLLFSLFYYGYHPISIPVVALSFVAFPYVFYSVFYQWRIAKMWCPLCLVVQAVLLLQLVLSIFAIRSNISFVPYSLLYIFLTGMFLTFLVFTLKSLLEKNIKNGNAKKNYNKLKNQPEVKEILFAKEYINTENIKKIIFFPEEDNIITYIFNPLCSPCIAKMESLFNIVENYENIGLEFIFCYKDATDDKEKSILFHFIEKYLESPDSFVSALKDYAKNYPASKNKFSQYKVNETRYSEVEEIWRNHVLWCLQNQINATPTILYNNRKLSEFYNLEDITYSL